ncbi:MAG: CheR family methyltransferase [Limisphaerales bacterium]
MSAQEGLSLLLGELIHERTGMYFDATRWDIMRDKLDPLISARKCNSLLDYYYILKYSDETGEEWHKVIDALAIQETYFWREIDQIKALTDVVIPEWFSHRITPFRIWSSACASGEEPLTISIALHEAGHGARPIQIIATDASRAALAKAGKGIYRERAFRNLSPELREKYFIRVDGGWQAKPEISRRITFRQANLTVKSDVSELAKVDAIFCRNVFIYFSPEVIRRTVRWMAEQLPEGRHLFVGAAESLLKLTTEFSLEQIGGALVYVRNKQSVPRALLSL